MTISSDIQKLDPGVLIELFTLDAVAIGGEVFHFHAGTNELGCDVVWQGVTYTRYPVEAEGFELRANGPSPRPKIRASNITGALGAAIRPHDEIIGAKVIRKRTFARYLDAVNFAKGNPLADPNVEFANEIYFIDRKSNENKVLIEWELVSALDLAGVKLPRRQIVANVCPWVYRGGECNYTGAPVATVTDIPTGDPALDKCGKRLASCKMRFKGTVLRYGGFPAAGLNRR